MTAAKKKKKEKPDKPVKKVNLSQRLIRVIASILILIMVVIIFITYRGLDFIYLAVSAVQTFYAAREVEDIFDDVPNDFDIKMDDIERTFEITIEAYLPDGRFVYTSAYKADISSPPYDSNSIVIPDEKKKNYTQTQFLGEVANNSFSLCTDESDGKNTEYLVFTWHTDEGTTLKFFKLKNSVDSNAKIAVGFISAVTITVVLIATIIITRFIRRTVKPVKEMSEITNSMSMLDFSKKCKEYDVKELSLLSDSINNMSDALEEALVDLQQRNKKLQEDIEQEKTLDQLRQLFISGVSHELKTPIAIIQGYAEGLKLFLETDPDMAAKYCDTIINETERMNNLVMKLLDIMKYQSGEYKQLFTEYNVSAMADDWFSRNAGKLKEKNITAINNIDPSFTGFGDTFIVSSVLNNYLSNAVSHVDGEMIIRAEAVDSDADTYRVSIINTGTPIAEKDIDKIWDSFYRADKAMSRAQGRFGLGLAIVASIQNLQHLQYGVINHEDSVEFWFDVKKKTAE